MSTSDKKLRPEKIVSYEKTSVDLDKIPFWVLFTSNIKKLFGFNADTYEYHETYDIYSRKKQKTSFTETFFIGFIMIIFLIVCYLTVYTVIKYFTKKDDNKQLVKNFIKVHETLTSNPLDGFKDRIVSDIGTKGDQPQMNDYKTCFDFNAFALWLPGGGKIPHQEKNCFSFEGGANPVGQPGPAGPAGPRGPVGSPPPNISFDTRAKPMQFKVIDRTGLAWTDLSAKMSNYFKKLKFRGENYYIFKSNSNSVMNTPFSAI